MREREREGEKRGEKRERDESGSSIYNAVMKLSGGDDMQLCLAHIIRLK